MSALVNNIVILKLGGSVITAKSKPQTLNVRAIKNIAKIISEFDKPIIVVHGAGSFGHYFAKRFRISNKQTTSTKAIIQIRESMIKLNSSIVEIFNKYKINTLSFSPISIYNKKNILLHWEDYLKKMLNMDMVPITYGDMILGSKGFYIISGDVIVKDLTRMLNPRNVVFASDIDGIYSDINDKSTLIKKVQLNKRYSVNFNTQKFDVTGGIQTKLKQALDIAQLGTNVQITNGLRPRMLMKALNGEHIGTLITGD